MNSPRANHFGNPLITSTVGNKIKAPASPVGSTFSKNDLINSKTQTIINRQSIEHLYLSLGQTQSQSQSQRGSTNNMPSSSSSSLAFRSPNRSFSERESSSQNESSLLGSTITTASSTIGLPSHYPGSANHHRINSLESSVLLEELQDFDDIFEQGQASSGHNSLVAHENNENEQETFVSRIRSGEYDDDDDLQSLSRSLPTRFTFQHRRNVSDLSALSLSTPPLLGVEIEKQSRSSSWINNSNHSSTSSSTRSSPTTISGRNHRRSRNRALSSTEFQSAVLDEL